MNIIECESWAAYKRELEDYAKLSISRRQQLIFRGQASRDWSLETTLDRIPGVANDEARKLLQDQLLLEFQRQSAGLQQSLIGVTTTNEWQFLARHHGLPTPILDWTFSPYVAAYFAFSSHSASQHPFASVWLLDLELFNSGRISAVKIIDEEQWIRINPRAIEQKGLFMRIASVQNKLEDMLGDSLVRYDIPSHDRRLALVDLDEMCICDRTLFRDLDSAARTSVSRLIEQR